MKKTSLPDVLFENLHELFYLNKTLYKNNKSQNLIARAYVSIAAYLGELNASPNFVARSGGITSARLITLRRSTSQLIL